MSKVLPFKRELRAAPLEQEEQLRFEEASVWIARLDKGLNADENLAFKRWAKDASNYSALLKMADLWDRMDSLSQLADMFPLEDSRPSSPVFAYSKMWAAAASIVLVLGFALVTLLNSGELQDMGDADHKRHYETAVGERSTVNLPDGSRLVLNTDSLVRINFSDNYRVLRLDRGELHVEVAPDISRPFSVLAGNSVVQAVGTIFNVELHSNKAVEVLVTEGKVRVDRRAALEPRAGKLKVEKLGSRATLVTQAQQLIISEKTIGNQSNSITKIPVKKLAEEDIEADLSWRKGNLIFRGESLEDAVAEISRYTSIQFTLADDAKIKKVRVAGMFKAGDVNGLLIALKENFRIDHVKLSEEKILLKAP